MEKEELSKRMFIAAILVLFAVVSFFILGRLFSNPQTYSAQIDSLDNKVVTTLRLTASATAASAGITALPDDIGTPIAQRLAEFSEYGFIIVCILYAEKYLMSMLGEAVFCVILPLTIVLYAFTLFFTTKKMPELLVKIALVSVALWIAIPFSIHVSDKIYETYTVSINQTISDAEQLTSDTSQLQAAGNDKNLLQRILTGLKTTVTGLADRGATLVNRFIESMAILVVISCIIPLLVLFFALWLIKQILGFDIPIPKPQHGRKLQNQLSESIHESD
ncbi:MAG: hypothetical protein IJI61_09910 [Oscillospiraceae bacterium]|nr:hypothetical protein [Oscillospiraceae bacterium]